MTEQEIEKVIDNHIQEDFEHVLWFLPNTGRKKILGKRSLIYLCKKCFKLGQEYIEQ